MTKSIILMSLGVYFGLTSLVQASVETTKKTVCSVTINSDNEIEQFKKKLSKDQWNFVELTQLEGEQKSQSQYEEKSWFAKACQNKIKCDILLISGHFGGKFFGESGLTLSMEELESNSCNADCDGIINQPKEVFLFGCNTLAGKEKDHRTPEAYLQVLLNDGFSRTQAEQVVAFRYSGFGDTFSSRMSQVFEKTPLIYGFYSVGPSGKNVESMVSKYLTESKAEYADFISYINAQGIQKNKKLFSALKSTALAQATGIKLYDSKWQSSERPYCYISNDKLSRLDKLKYVVNVMLSGRTLNIMPHIKKFIKEFYDSKTATNEELKEIQKVASSEKVKKDFDKILELNGDVYLGLKLDTAFLMKALSFKTENQYQSYVQNVIRLDEIVTLEKRDRLCSLEIEVSNIDPKTVHKDNWSNKYFYQLLECLNPQNEPIHMEIVDVMKNDSNEYVRQSAAYALGEIKPQSEAIHRALAEVMKTDSNKYSNKYLNLRGDAANALGKIKPQSEVIHRALVEVMKTDSNEYVRQSAAYALGEIKPQSEAIHRALVEVMKTDSNEYVRRRAADALDKIKANSR